jgi:hypothetical protein
MNRPFGVNKRDSFTHHQSCQNDVDIVAAGFYRGISYPKGKEAIVSACGRGLYADPVNLARYNQAGFSSSMVSPAASE